MPRRYAPPRNSPSGACRSGSGRRAPTRSAPRRRMPAAVADLEREVNAVTVTLDDPELYTRPGGVEEATRLGVRLEALRAQLEAALAAWEQETASLEALERAMSPS